MVEWTREHCDLRKPEIRAQVRDALLAGGPMDAEYVLLPDGTKLTGTAAYLTVGMRKILKLALDELDAAKVGVP